MKLIKSKYFKFLPDKMYLKLKYFVVFHKKLDLTNPKTFNEKINWLKLYDRKDVYTKMVDKYEAKHYISKIVGNDYIIPTLGVYDNFDDIDFDQLPNKFVLKCTHDCGGLVICKDKSSLNKEEARLKIEKSLKKNYYYDNREWPYKNVKPRIIAEKYMEDSQTEELRDYKFFCFNGEPMYMFIATDRNKHETKFNFYDMEYNLLPIKQHYPNNFNNLPKPKTFDQMKNLAKKLSKGLPHIRVDFYEVDGKVYVGELTFSHFGGFVPFEPQSWDRIFGDLIDIEGVK